MARLRTVDFGLFGGIQQVPNENPEEGFKYNVRSVWHVPGNRREITLEELATFFWCIPASKFEMFARAIGNKLYQAVLDTDIPESDHSLTDGEIQDCVDSWFQWSGCSHGYEMSAYHVELYDDDYDYDEDDDRIELHDIDKFPEFIL